MDSDTQLLARLDDYSSEQLLGIRRIARQHPSAQTSVIARLAGEVISRRARAILEQTVHAPDLERSLRDTQGPDPWDTRSAPGRGYEGAFNRAPVVRADR